MPTRREVLKWGVAAGGAVLAPTIIAKKTRGSGDSDAPDLDFGSPETTPFRDALPAPPPPTEVGPFPDLDPNACAEEDRQGARYFHLVEEETHVKLHTELPPTKVWRYRDAPMHGTLAPTLGPTFMIFMGQQRQTVFVRHTNNLPPHHQGFGIPCTTAHYHGGHVEARSDGFPENQFDGPHPFPGPVVISPPGLVPPDPVGDVPVPHGCEPGAPSQYDYCYAMRDAGFSHIGDPDGPGFRPGDERPATQWYHDHLFDFTGPNVVRGLAGLFLVFDELDDGNEHEDPDRVIEGGPYDGRKPLRLPSGYGVHDIPLVIQDRLIDANGQLVYPPGEHDGFLGDKFMVNGMVQPFLRVKRRKYRLRTLNGSNARFYQLFLTDDRRRAHSFDRIANAGGLFAAPIRNLESVMLGNADRADIIVDFSQFRPGDKLYLENRLEQDDGRGPDGKFGDTKLVERGTRLMQFIVEGGDVDDPSEVPDVLRPFAPVSELLSRRELRRLPRREFRFERRRGAWAINNELAELDFQHSVAQPRTNRPEIWHLTNHSGGWWHPIHIHLEFMRVLQRNGGRPPLEERDGFARLDTVMLGPGDNADVYVDFRDYPGPWVFHCHNIEHEDMRMMARFDVVHT